MPTLAGWVYVLASPHCGGVVKIGRTTRNGPDRAAELNRSPGYRAYAPWHEVWCKPVHDCVRVETTVHRMLAHRRVRLDDVGCRELFRVDIEDACAVVEAAAASLAAGGGIRGAARGYVAAASVKEAYRIAKRRRRVAGLARCFALGAALAGLALYEGLLSPTMAILRGLDILP